MPGMGAKGRGFRAVREHPEVLRNHPNKRNVPKTRNIAAGGATYRSVVWPFAPSSSAMEVFLEPERREGEEDI